MFHERGPSIVTKTTRLAQYDYAQHAAYFVTLCCHHREQLLGEIVDGRVRHSRIGELAANCWVLIPQHFPFVTVDETVIMPNHLHGILLLEGGAEEESRHEAFGRPVAGSLATILRSYKAAVTRQARNLMAVSFTVWQSGYYERIIRNRRELTSTRDYIQNNPLRWQLDRLNDLV